MALEMESAGWTDNSKCNDWKQGNQNERKQEALYTETLKSKSYFKLEEITKGTLIRGRDRETEKSQGIFPSCKHFEILYWKLKAVFHIQTLLCMWISACNRVSSSVMCQVRESPLLMPYLWTEPVDV